MYAVVSCDTVAVQIRTPYTLRFFFSASLTLLFKFKNQSTITLF
jgi:hypothetical protein